ncbi:MAG: hypothetical protein RL701_1456 [Pseudomonadota bacterium]
MQFAHQGLALWYDTADAPAPAEHTVGMPAPSLTIGVRPANPGHSVRVHYRSDGGLPATLTAVRTHTDFTRQVQFFRAVFPCFRSPQLIEYSPVLLSTGRQVPPPPLDRQFPSSFRVVTPNVASVPPQLSAAAPHVPHTLELVSRVSAQLSTDPEFIGENADCVRVNFFIEGGSMSGPRLTGHVRKRGVDSMHIRRDGIGIVRVRAVLETHDHALIDADYTGVIDFGPDGYERAKVGKFPDQAPIELAPQLLTGDARYAWLNRKQLLGVGHVDLTTRWVTYDLLAVPRYDSASKE